MHVIRSFISTTADPESRESHLQEHDGLHQEDDQVGGCWRILQGLHFASVGYCAAAPSET